MAVSNKLVFCFFMLLTYLSGTAAASFVPVMSIFLTDIVKATPTQVGTYFTVAAIVGIVVTQVLAKFSDKRLSRKFLICLAGASGFLAALVFIFIPFYYCIVTLGVLFLSISSVGTPQIFASGREYGISKYGNSLMFTTYMRSFFSLAWVLTPPVAYLLANNYGFKILFIFTAVIFVVFGVLGRYCMPDTKEMLNTQFNPDDNPERNGEVETKDNKDDKSASQVATKNEDAKSERILGNKDVMLLFLAITLLWTCNNVYLISMPIYITKELAINSNLPGFMMAAAAFLEIPVMLLAGLACKKFGIKPLIILCAICGVIFYLGILSVPQHELFFIGVQLFNALFIGILAGLGMIYFQELLPKIPGQATTLFNNTVNTGAIISGGLVAIVAQQGSYSNAFIMCIGLTAVASLILFAVRKV